jgi:general secretion pathway protein D
MRRFLGPRGVALAVAIWTLAAGAPAAAATLAGLRVDAAPTGGAVVTLNFSGGAPQWSVLGAGTQDATIVLQNTQINRFTSPSVPGAGSVTSVNVVQSGNVTSVILHLSGVATVRVRPGGAALYVDVPPASGGAPGFRQPGFGVPTPSPATGLGSITEIVELKYADVSEIAGVLVQGANIASNDTFTPTQTNIGTSSLNGTFGGGTGGFQGASPAQNFGQFGQQQGVAQRVSDNIAIDRRLNAIILTGPPDVVDQLKAVIAKIDIPVDSVLLETQIVELDETAAVNLGLDLSPDGSGIVANGSSASSNGYKIAVSAFPTGSATFQANLYAQITSGKGRQLAKPRILSQSGQQASILTGDAIPIFTNIAVQNVGTAQQVNYVNVGVNLQIAPRVSSDGYVTSHVYSEVSSVTGLTNGAPQISQRTASTIATVRDGESFVIGGLLQDNEIRSLSKLPFIGDLPIIGALFRHISTTHSQTNLYIIVTPHIVARVGAPPAQASPQQIPGALRPLPFPSSAPLGAPHP